MDNLSFSAIAQQQKLLQIRSEGSSIVMNGSCTENLTFLFTHFVVLFLEAGSYPVPMAGYETKLTLNSLRATCLEPSSGGARI